jgi:hypothetical protein
MLCREVVRFWAECPARNWYVAITKLSAFNRRVGGNPSSRRRFSKPPPSRTVLTVEIFVRQNRSTKDERRTSTPAWGRNNSEFNLVSFLLQVGNHGL